MLGGGGALGSAVLEQLLASHRFERVGVLARPTLQPALRGLQVVADDDEAAWARFGADTALIVFDRERGANGREVAFVRAQPSELAAQAARLRGTGVRHLLVVVPHAPALLPQALKAGLATLDEGAVAAMDFDHVVFMRMAQSGVDAAQALHSRAQRLAGWMLSQLHWMVPQREQPVRGITVARIAAALAVALPGAPRGTRVLPHEWLWLAAQGHDAGDLVARWLGGQPPPPSAGAKQRW